MDDAFYKVPRSFDATLVCDDGRPVTMHAHATGLTHGGHDVEHCSVDGGQED